MKYLIYSFITEIHSYQNIKICSDATTAYLLCFFTRNITEVYETYIFLCYHNDMWPWLTSTNILRPKCNKQYNMQLAKSKFFACVKFQG